MEIRIVVFLVLVSVAVITNTLLIFFAFKAFVGVTTTVTQTVSGFEKSSEIRQWIDSLKAASEQAVAASETTKQKIVEFGPALGRVQESYNRTLIRVDSRLEEAADGINSSARKMRDLVATPAFSAMAFAAGLAKIFEPTDED